jgi:glycosyltransferase involved in cell wall biosynthesis
MADRVHALYSVDRSRITVAPGGVDLDTFAPATDPRTVRTALGLPLDRPLLLTIRRLYARMGLENLVAAMARVVQQQSEALLLIGGTGPRRAHLEALISRLGLSDQVRLLGRVSEDDLPRYYQAADLFVLPTVALEGFGLVTLEALACGTPVVGTPVGGTPEILAPLHPRLLCASPGPEDVAETVLDVLADPPVSRSQCRSFVEARYSWDRLADDLEGLLCDPEVNR